MVSPEQCRAARAWLGWPQDELAKRAKIGLSTLKDFESGKRAPMRNNLEAIQHAIEAAGLRLAFRKDGTPLGILTGELEGSGDDPRSVQ